MGNALGSPLLQTEMGAEWGTSVKGQPVSVAKLGDEDASFEAREDERSD